MKKNQLKVLLVGGGGREHALAWKLSQSQRVAKIYCAPGNAGIAEFAECLAIKADDIEALCAFAEKEAIDLAVIGPEGPLALGIVDAFDSLRISCFGPDKSCARLEASKAFTKDFLKRHRIPTAKYAEFTEADSALEAIGIFGWPMVIKADGLAAGKGVIIAEDPKQAETAIREMMQDKVFGCAGDRLVIEEFLTGTEASVLCFVDGKTIVPMESAQDYKKIYDGDKGPNTGGMGAYSPSLIFDASLERTIRDQILTPTMSGFYQDDLNFKGVLFIGLMIGSEGPKVIEFNVRFGDPETQAVLMRLETDLVDIMESVIEGKLDQQQIAWSQDSAICVVLAAGGYPGDYDKGDVISGLDTMPEDILVFHAGTRFKTVEKDITAKSLNSNTFNAVVTNGGRVLGVCARAKTTDEAREKIYGELGKISFKGMQYRKDIGIIVE